MKPNTTFSYEDTEFAGLPTSSSEQPRTVKDVLLERWAKNTRELARRMIWHDATRRHYHSVDGYGENLTLNGFNDLDEAWDHQISYLNSAAEGATK